MSLLSTNVESAATAATDIGNLTPDIVCERLSIDTDVLCPTSAFRSSAISSSRIVKGAGAFWDNRLCSNPSRVTSIYKIKKINYIFLNALQLILKLP